MRSSIFFHICFVVICLLAGFQRVLAQPCIVPASCIVGNAGSLAIPGTGIFSVQIGSINKISLGASQGYGNFSCTDTARIIAGTITSITINTGATVNENVRVWIDFNANTIFESNELVLVSNDKKIHSGPIQIPGNVVINTRVRMRVSADIVSSPVPTPCSTPQFSQVEDFSIRFLANTAPPVARFFSIDTLTCNGLARFTDQSLGAPTQWRWFFGNGSISSSQSPIYQYTGSGNYTVKLVVNNAFGKDSTTKTSYIRYNDTIPVAPFCAPQTLNACCNYGITRVRIANLDNNSEDASAGYENFTCTRARIKVLAGANHSLTITTNPNENQDTRVWIDYNNNGDFETGELIGQSFNSKNPVFSISIPVSPTLINTPLRLRISSDFAGSSFTACTSLERGQAEDYTLIIRPNTLPPVANFVLSTAVSQNICNPQIRLRSTSQNKIDSVRWFFGNGQTAVSTDTIISYTYSNAGNYSIKMIAFGPFGKDSITRTNFVRYAPAPLASCEPIANSPCCNVGIYRVRLNTLDFSSSWPNPTGTEPSYYNLSCSQFVSLNRATSNTLRVNTNPNFFENVRAWIDFNNNGSFENNERILSSATNNQHIGTFVVPPTAVENQVLRMRIMSGLDPLNTISACNNLNAGQIEDYGILINPSPRKPTAGFFTLTPSSCSGVVAFQDSTQWGANQYLWTFGDGSSSSARNPIHTYTQLGLYSVKLKVSNATGTDSLTGTNYINITQLSGMSPAVCSPLLDMTSARLTLVSFAGTSIIAASPTQGYSDLSCLKIVPIVPSVFYPIQINTNTSTLQTVRVWIDQNNNGSFESSELVADTAISSSFVRNIRVQNIIGLQTGQTLRIRVTTINGNQKLTACQPGSGQSIDFGLALLAATIPPVAGFSANITSTCNDTIRFTNSIIGAFQTIRWDFGNGQSSNLANPKVFYNQPGIYSVKLSVFNAAGKDSIIRTNYINISPSNGLKTAACAPSTQANIVAASGITRVSFGTISRTSPGNSEGYQNLACSLSTIMLENTPTPMTITISGFSQRVFVLLDRNNNGAFEANETLFDSVFIGTITRNFNINPATAVLNTNLRLRVLSNEGFFFPGFCGVLNGHAEDYSVRVIPNILPPVANFTVDASLACRGSVRFINQTQNNAVSFLWKFGDGNQTTVAAPTHQYTSAGNYTVTLIAYNNFGQDSVVKTNVVQFAGLLNIVAPLCRPVSLVSDPNSSFGIVRVRLNSLDYSSGSAATEGYKDFICIDSTQLSPGQNYNLIVRTGSANVERTAAWIDYNNNGNFALSERIMLTAAIGERTVAFTVPNSTLVVLNIPLRLRVISTTNNINDISTACPPTSIINGQVEDYTVYITDPTSIKNRGNNMQIKLWPNPANHTLRIETEENANLELIDILGKIVLRTNLLKNENAIDISKLPKGIYIAKIFTSDKQTTKKVVIE